VKIALTLIAPALLLAGTASAQDSPFRAQGVAPHWQVTIADGLIRYQDGRDRVTLPAPTPIIGFAGEIYRAPGISINVVHTRCTIAGSALVYPDQVGVTWRGRTMRGCGGDPAGRPPMGRGPGSASLDGSAWSIASVDGVPVTTARPTSIRFSNGRVEGNAGCNSFGGLYAQRGPVLSASRIVATKMGCPGPEMQIEGRVLRILEEPATLAYRADGTLVLSAAASSMILSRERWAR
jgi:heat shock protein HslJ